MKSQQIVMHHNRLLLLSVGNFNTCPSCFKCLERIAPLWLASLLFNKIGHISTRLPCLKSLEYVAPLLLKPLLVNKLPIFYAYRCMKHRWIATCSELTIDLSKLPVKLLTGLEFREVLRDEFDKELTQVGKLSAELVAVKLEGAIHNATVV